MEILNSVAMVAGSDTALGSSVAFVLENIGARVIRLNAKGSAPQLMRTSPPQLSFVVDMADPRSVAETFRHVEATVGPPRILVNCHGFLDRFPIVEATPGSKVSPCGLERCAQVVTSNLVGSFDIFRLFAASAASLAPLHDEERGVLINVVSESADDGAVNEVALAASMGGIAAMTLPLARELGRYGIRVLCVTAVDFADSPSEETEQDFAHERSFPNRRGKPREFAELVISLVSNPMMNGTSVRIDGGGRMKSARRGVRA
jgi:NAD(P)-dependent dehydrogenase (short-subunit alcohol dehydrogenase family)